MKYLKMTGLAVLAATALIAFAGAGTATAKSGVACSNSSDPCTAKWTTPTTIDFSLESGTSFQVESTVGAALDTCTKSTFTTKLIENPNPTGTATSENTEITWGDAATLCKWLTAPTTLGKLKFEAEAQNPMAGNALVYADTEIEVTVTVSGFFGGPCIYRVPAGTQLGTFNEANQTITFNAVIERTQTAEHPCVFGTQTAKMTGLYVKTSPATTLWFSTS